MLNDNHFKEMKRIFESAIKSNRFCSIATVGKDGMPHITPIGFIYFNDKKLTYFEEFTKKIPENLEYNSTVCVLVVNSGLRFWLSSLIKGKFATPPGIRLVCKAGDLRDANSEDAAFLERKLSSVKWTKGSKAAWTGLSKVRDLEIIDYHPISYPVLTEGLVLDCKEA